MKKTVSYILLTGLLLGVNCAYSGQISSSDEKIKTQQPNAGILAYLGKVVIPASLAGFAFGDVYDRYQDYKIYSEKILLDGHWKFVELYNNYKPIGSRPFGVASGAGLATSSSASDYSILKYSLSELLQYPYFRNNAYEAKCKELYETLLQQLDTAFEPVQWRIVAGVGLSALALYGIYSFFFKKTQEAQPITELKS